MEVQQWSPAAGKGRCVVGHCMPSTKHGQEEQALARGPTEVTRPAVCWVSREAPQEGAQRSRRRRRPVARWGRRLHTWVCSGHVLVKQRHENGTAGGTRPRACLKPACRPPATSAAGHCHLVVSLGSVLPSHRRGPARK